MPGGFTTLREQNLEKCLRELVDCVMADIALKGHVSYKGKGISVLKEDVDRLPAVIRYAEELLK